MFSSNGLEFPRGPCLGGGLFLSQKTRQEKDPVRVPRRTQRNESLPPGVRASEACCGISKCGAAGGGRLPSPRQVRESRGEVAGSV